MRCTKQLIHRNLEMQTGNEFYFLTFKYRRRREGGKKANITLLFEKKPGNTQAKDELGIQRNESSVKNKLNPHSPLFRDDSASGVPLSHSCAPSIHWRGRIHTFYSENLDGTQGTCGLTEHGFSYAHRSCAERA